MDSAFLRDLAIVIVTAAGTTLVCRLLRQPVVIGYLIAGLIIGPHTPPFSLVNDLHSIHTMAELGLVVLMFVLGLEFSLPKLRKVGTRAVLATILEIFGMLAIGYGVGRALGWSAHDSVYLGAILSISSTTIIVKVLTDLKLVQEEFAQAVFGILILEDIAAVVILTVLSGLGARQGTEGLTVLRAIGDVGFFVALFLIVGLAVVPRFLKAVGRFKSDEMTGLVAFGLCLLSAIAASYVGFSVALGAFLMGAVIGVSSEAETIESWIHPIRDLFSALFFVSAGLLIDPHVLWSIKGPVTLITGVTVVGKMLTGSIGSFLAGYSVKSSFRVGMTLAQIGEFSFVFASLGLKTGLGSEFLYPLAVAVSGLTALLTPYLIRYSDRAAALFAGVAPRSLTHRLERYHERRKTILKAQEGTTVLSRYLWRLGCYAVLLTAGFLITKGFDRFRIDAGHTATAAGLVVWVSSWWIQLPLIHAVAAYVNHFLLLVLTELSVRSKASWLLQRIPIQRAYDVLEGLTWVAMALIWVLQAVGHPLPLVWVSVALGLMMSGAWLARKGVVRMYGQLESLLDEVLGLASSEPLRRAAIAVDGPSSLLNESISRVMLTRRSAAVNRSLRDLRLREQTGASVIGIYRNGQLRANPSPETVLVASDILVLLGDPAECRQAEQFLRG